MLRLRIAAILMALMPLPAVSQDRPANIPLGRTLSTFERYADSHPDAAAQLSAILGVNDNLYTYLVQVGLKDAGFFKGQPDGLLTHPTLQAVYAYCVSVGAAAQCGAGPLTPEAARILEGLGKAGSPATAASAAPATPVPAASGNAAPGAADWIPAHAVTAFDLSTGRSFNGHQGFARATGALWAPDRSGLKSYAKDMLRRADGVGAILEPSRQNKSANFNANPTDLTGVTLSGDPAAELTVVRDVGALREAGLEEVCTSGFVFKLDNSAGTATANADIAGNAGNTRPHVASAYVRAEGQAKAAGAVRGNARFADGAAQFAAGKPYERASTPLEVSSAGLTLRIEAYAGQTVYFILNQLEEGLVPSTPIVTAGAPAERKVDVWKGTSRSEEPLDWHVRYADGSESVVARGATEPLILNPQALSSPVVTLIWSEKSS